MLSRLPRFSPLVSRPLSPFACVFQGNLLTPWPTMVKHTKLEELSRSVDEQIVAGSARDFAQDSLPDDPPPSEGGDYNPRLGLKSPPSLGGGSSGNKSWAKSRADPATICSSTDLLSSSILVYLTMIGQGVYRFPWNTHAKGDERRGARFETVGSAKNTLGCYF